MGESDTRTKEEEVQLCESWAAVTVCPITANHQTLLRMWLKVHEHYIENWMGSTPVRPLGALQAHFKPLKKIVKEWHNAKIQSERQINLKFIRVTKKQFDHHECWEVVKDHPSFRNAPTPPVAPFVYSMASGSQTESPIDLDEEVVLETPPSSVGRPMGQKAAKEARRKVKNKEDVGESMVQALLAISESNKISNEILRKKEENHCAEYEKIMTFEEAKEDARIMGMPNNDKACQTCVS
ncbi:PREDICTED: uncharacterized protein LOC101296597 [Fragaria vesca subsp. vesca]